MEAIECMKERRSIRAYKPEQIPDEKLLQVLDAATYAPTALGLQTPLIVAVQDKEDIETMSRLNARVMGKTADPFYGAPTVVVVFGDSTKINYLQDASLVLGNMMNAAYAVDLGSCWINRAKETFEFPEGKLLMEKWGIPEEYVGVGSCILGYPDCALPDPKPRKQDYYTIIR